MLTIEGFGCACASTVETPAARTAVATRAYSTRLKRDMTDSFAPRRRDRAEGASSGPVSASALQVANHPAPGSTPRRSPSGHIGCDVSQRLATAAKNAAEHATQD